MAPKKKLKHGASVAANCADRVPSFLQATKDFVDELYETRHATASDEPVKPAPFLHGGHLKSIAQRAWGDSAKLLSASKSMIEKAGICDLGLNMEEFCDLFLRMKAGRGPTILLFWSSSVSTF